MQLRFVVVRDRGRPHERRHRVLIAGAHLRLHKAKVLYTPQSGNNICRDDTFMTHRRKASGGGKQQSGMPYTGGIVIRSVLRLFSVLTGFPSIRVLINSVSSTTSAISESPSPYIGIRLSVKSVSAPVLHWENRPFGCDHSGWQIPS